MNLADELRRLIEEGDALVPLASPRGIEYSDEREPEYISWRLRALYAASQLGESGLRLSAQIERDEHGLLFLSREAKRVLAMLGAALTIVQSQGLDRADDSVLTAGSLPDRSENIRSSAMTIGDIIWNEQAAIVRSSHMAIVHGMLDTYTRCGQRSSLPQEPDFVAGLVLESTPLIYSTLKALLTPHGIAVSMASVFCHQTPQVTHSLDSKSCELGDLLFVHIHTDRSAKVRRNALLYQAKMSSKQPYKVPKSETHQLALYTDWPQFSYKSPGDLAGAKRDINPKVPHTGAQYMLIDDRPPSDPQSGLLCIPGTYPIGSCMADKCLHDHNHLAQELFDLLRWRSGKAFDGQTRNPPTDEWSRTIWDSRRRSIAKTPGATATPGLSAGPSIWPTGRGSRQPRRVLQHRR